MKSDLIVRNEKESSGLFVSRLNTCLESIETTCEIVSLDVFDRDLDGSALSMLVTYIPLPAESL